MAALGFIPAIDHDAFSFGTEQKSTNKSSKISGEEVRRFYEDLIKDDKTQKDQSLRATHGNNRDRERAQELQGLRLLRCAHQGDIPGLKELISKGVDINFQDSYLWTAVMCASWSGQKAAVRLLLMHGAAWVGVVDTRGKDAQDLASEAGHDDVLKELLSFGKSPERETHSHYRLEHVITTEEITPLAQITHSRRTKTKIPM
uniref:G-patch domain and ankyrin repeats 1 n=1 Tax=Xiphophorus maculatus TaxID=8083 RepID=A0A3B5QEH9_XIPMA